MLLADLYAGSGKRDDLNLLWTAATLHGTKLGRKLSYAKVFTVDLMSIIDSICSQSEVTLIKSAILLKGSVVVHEKKVTYFLTECERFHDQLKFPLQLQRDKQKKQKSKTKKDPNVLFGLEKLDDDVPDIKFDNAFFNQNKARIDQITLRDDSEFLNIGDMNLDEAELSTIFANGMDFNDPELLKEMEEICKASIEDQTLLSNNMTVSSINEHGRRADQSVLSTMTNGINNSEMQAPEIPLPEISIMNKPVNPDMTMDMTGGKSILTTPGSVMTPGAVETPSMINAQISTPKEQEEITAIKKKKKTKLFIDNELCGDNPGRNDPSPLIAEPDFAPEFEVPDAWNSKPRAFFDFPFLSNKLLSSSFEGIFKSTMVADNQSKRKKGQVEEQREPDNPQTPAQSLLDRTQCPSSKRARIDPRFTGDDDSINKFADLSIQTPQVVDPSLQNESPFALPEKISPPNFAELHYSSQAFITPAEASALLRDPDVQRKSVLSIIRNLPSRTKTNACRVFYQTLVEAAKEEICIDQRKPFEDITVHVNT